MRLDQITSSIFEQLFGRMLRRAALALLLGILALAALYHFTVAGTLALEAQYGVLYARLMVAGLYTAGALASLAALYVTRIRPLLRDDAPESALANPRHMQVAMLVEAAMLGFALARKAPRQP